MKGRSTSRALLMCTVLLVCLSGLYLFGCRSQSTARYFSYLDTPAQAELTGKLDGIPFAATLYSEGRSQGATQTMPDFSLTFSAPASLAGMTVRYSAETDEWRLSLDELSGETDAAGLGALAATLMCESPVQSTRREQNRIILTTLDGTLLTLDERTGKPIKATCSQNGRAIEIVVTRWE